MDWEGQVEDVRVVLCTVPDAETGERIARELVESRLAACVNLIPALRSVFRWEGKICDETEALMVIKTTRQSSEALTQKVASVHPYDTPEVICLPVAAGLGKYLQWVRDEVGS